MSENNYLRRVPFTFERVYEEWGKYYYEKSKSEYLTYLTFYLRFCSKHWKPCPECQANLMKTIQEADTWIFGNEKTDPMVELSKHTDEINDDAWESVEKREITEQEAEKMHKEQKIAWG
jgi:hypothetical protein